MTRCLLIVACVAPPALAEPCTDAHGDPLPDGALVRFGTIRDRIGSVRARYSFALSPDGRTIAAEDRDGIGLWDAETGRVTRRLPWRTWQGDNPTFALCFSPDGKYLARLAGRVVALWDLAEGTEVFDIDLKEKGKCQAIAFVQGENRIVATSERAATAFEIDAKTGRVIAERALDVPVHWISASGRTFLGVAGSDLTRLDAKSGKIRCRISNTKAELNSPPVLSPDDHKLYLAERSGRMRVFDAATGKQLEDHSGPVLWARSGSPVAVTLSPDGAVAYLSKTGRPIHRHDLNGGKWLDPLAESPGGPVLSLPGQRVLIVGNDGILHRYDLKSLKEIPPTDGFEDRVFAVPSPGGKRVVVASGNDYRRLDLFDISGRSLWSLRPRTAELGRPRWTPDGGQIACVGSTTITFRDAATGKAGLVLRTSGEGQRLSGSVFFPPNRDRLIAPVNFGKAVATFDLKTGARTALTSTNPWPIDLSPDGRTLLCAQDEGGLKLFDLARGRVTAECPKPSGRDRWTAAPAAKFSPDGSYILSWETEQARAPTWAPKTFAVLRDPVTLLAKREFEAEEAGIVAISPDGQWLAMGKYSGMWVLYDVPLGDRVGRWEGHRGYISNIGFAGPGRVLTGSDDLTALLWDLRPKEMPTRWLWAALASNNARTVYRAVWALAADPKAPEMLRARVTISPAPPADKVKQWVADLSANRFAVRELATTNLQELGRLIEPDLRAARDATTAAEARDRLDGLLARLPRERVGIEVLQARAVAAM